MEPVEPNLPVLAFIEATIEPDGALDSALERLSLELRPGELALVRLERGVHPPPLADAAQGLARPSSGRVEFLGRDWTDLGPAEAARTRACIGRVFEERAWVSNLDVAENVTLAERHHTARPVEEILAEAESLARRFGLPGLPPGRPATATRNDLIRAGWVRAFLGSPPLLVLEQPTRQVDHHGAALLVEAVREARERGAAALWLTQETRILSETALDPVLRLRVAGAQILEEEGGP